MTIAHSTGRVRSGEVSIFYRKLGNRGQGPILIVHGLSYFSYDWLEIGQVLAADREIVAMDMRGFGDSDWSPQKDYSVPSMAQDIVNVLDHPGWTRALLVGHSMGGRGTTYVAARHAQRVAGLAPIERARRCRVEVIVVTGGLGYIGSHTCVVLAEAGYELAIVDNLSNSKPSVLERIRELSPRGARIALERADVRDRAALEPLLSNAEAVIHFAGLK